MSCSCARRAESRLATTAAMLASLAAGRVHAVSPMLQVGAGANFGHVWFFEPTLEVGLRCFRPQSDAGDVAGEASSAVEERLVEFINGGSADFSGVYVRTGLVFFD
jgi:hypothetical protein